MKVTDAQLKALTPDQAAFLTPDALKAFKTTMVDTAVGNSTGDLGSASFAGVTPAALKAMLPNVLAAMHPDTFAGITPEQVAVLTTAQVKVLTAPQIAKFDIDDAAALTPAQTAVFTSTQATAFTTVAIPGITPDAIAKLSLAGFDGTYQATTPTADFAVLTNEQFQKLTAAQVALITPAQAAVIMPGQIEGVKTLGSLPNNSANVSASITSLTTAVVAALETAQISKFDVARLEAFTETQAAKFNSDVTDWAYTKGYSVVTGTTTLTNNAATVKGIQTGATVVGDVTTASTIVAGKNAVTITGGAAADKITGSPKDDTINPGTASDTSLVDTIDAGAGADTLNYAVGNLIASNVIIDSIEGGDGVDSIVVTGSIAIDGSSTTGLARATGVEKLVAAANSAGALTHSITLASDAALSGFTTIDLSADVHASSTAAVTLTGSTNNFTVVGLAAGVNTFTANAGNNNVTGGSNADVFKFNIGQLDSSDTVAGGTGSDKIWLASDSDSVEDTDFTTF